jgi:hypothetical protein
MAKRVATVTKKMVAGRKAGSTGTKTGRSKKPAPRTSKNGPAKKAEPIDLFKSAKAGCDAEIQLRIDEAAKRGEKLTISVMERQRMLEAAAAKTKQMYLEQNVQPDYREIALLNAAVDVARTQAKLDSGYASFTFDATISTLDPELVGAEVERIGKLDSEGIHDAIVELQRTHSKAFARTVYISLIPTIIKQDSAKLAELGRELASDVGKEISGLAAEARSTVQQGVQRFGGWLQSLGTTLKGTDSKPSGDSKDSCGCGDNCGKKG